MITPRQQHSRDYFELILMNQISTCVALVGLIMLLASSGYSQSSEANPKHFKTDTLSFDYPSEWTLSDASVDELQYLIMTSADKTAQMAVVTQRDPGISCASELRSKNVTKAFVDQLASQIHAKVPLQTSLVPIKVGANEIQATQFHGERDGKPVTAFVIGVIINKWFVNLVLVKPVGDDASLTAWSLVRSSLYVAEPVLTAPSKIVHNGGVLNGKAIKLAQPPYPQDARYRRAGGIVVIDVEIDEMGNVTLACVRSGHPLLRDVSLDAARQSKFSPTKIDGQPIRVIGVIQYNFVSQ